MRDATLKIKLNNCGTKETAAELNDYWPSVSEYDTLDELEGFYPQGIQTNHEKQEFDQKVENDLIDQVEGGMKAEIPTPAIESRIGELSSGRYQYRISSRA